MHGSAVTIPRQRYPAQARGVDVGNRNTRYARGLVPSLEAHQVVCQDGVRDFAGNTQILRLTCVRSPSSQTKRRPS